MFFLDVVDFMYTRWDGTIWPRLLEHLYISGASIFFITVLGIALGIAMAKSKVAEKILSTLVSIIYTIPSIAMFGFLIALPFFGLDKLTAIVALVLYGLLPVMRNTFVGIKELDKSVLEAGYLAGTTKFELLWFIEIPLALPYILAGLRTALVMTVALTAIASFIGAGGLGVLIWTGISSRFTVMIFVGGFLISLLAVLVDRLMAFLEFVSQQVFD